jgi:hypothetical protein
MADGVVDGVILNEELLVVTLYLTRTSGWNEGLHHFEHLFRFPYGKVFSNLREILEKLNVEKIFFFCPIFFCTFLGLLQRLFLGMIGSYDDKRLPLISHDDFQSTYYKEKSQTALIPIR